MVFFCYVLEQCESYIRLLIALFLQEKVMLRVQHFQTSPLKPKAVSFTLKILRNSKRFILYYTSYPMFGESSAGNTSALENWAKA